MNRPKPVPLVVLVVLSSILINLSNKEFKVCLSIKSDLFEEMQGIKFDIIVSNPPYIPKKDIETLHTQVKDYEPYNALEGGEDGLDFYRQITEESIKYLKQGGILAYEVGHDQAEDVSKIMKYHGYDKIYTKKDIQGIDRAVIGFKL